MRDINKLRNLDALKITLASPQEVLSWSYGEVLKPETINYRSYKPEKDGLFCEKIFGPVKDYECYCGKYKRIRYKGVTCDRCGVQVTTSKVRRERMGHITLASPVVHVWFFKNIPSVLAALLGISPKNLEFVVYFSSFVVTNIDYTAKEKVMSQFDGKVDEARELVHQEIESRIKEVLSVAEDNVKSLNPKKSEKDWSEDLKVKAEKIRKKALKQVDDIKSSEFIEAEKAEIEVKKTEKKLREVELHTVMTDSEYIELEEYLDEFCEVSIGAEAVKTLLQDLDLKELVSEIRNELIKAKASNLKKLMRRLKIAETFVKSGVPPTSMIVEVLPVIPPDLRPMVQLEGGRFATSDLNDLYRRIINRNNRLKRLIDLGAPNIIIRNEKRMLQEAVDALIDSSKVRKTRIRSRKEYRSLADNIKGKQGYFRANLLGKRVDYSGRAVIVSGPDLKVNECGLPREMALELFRPFVIREIMIRGLAPNMKTAKYVLDERRDEVWSILDDLVKERPVLLNRAPTLHRLSIQAFYPKLTDGKAIQLHPVVCAGFNADFDGDQMAVHLPLSEEAVKEAKELMISTKNILKPADGAVIMYPSKDMVLGIYYLTSLNESIKPSKIIHSSVEEVLQSYNNGKIELRQLVKLYKDGKLIDTTVGRVMFNQLLHFELGFLNETVTNVRLKRLIVDTIDVAGVEKAIKLIDSFKEYGFRYATKSGISLSIFDCKEPADLHETIEKTSQEVDQIDQNYKMGLITSVERSRLSHRVWQAAIDHFDSTVLNSLGSENPVSLIVSAGASKASALQIRQISAIKGLVPDPSGKIIDMPILGNYAYGMSSFDYYLTARGVRRNYMDKGLGTADAGYLTRRLVNVAQEVLVREDDCGTKEGVYISRDEKTPLMEWEDRIVGRTAANVIKAKNSIIVKKGEIISTEAAEKIAKADLEGIKIRSALTCNTRYGVCAKCYGISLTNSKPVEIGAAVGIIAAQSIGEPGTQLTMRTFHSGGVVKKDITQGLPRVEEVFEARKPKSLALMSDVAGKVKLGKGDITIIPLDKKQSPVVYDIDPIDEITVSDGDLVGIGSKLTLGNLDLQTLYKSVGLLETQKYMINEIQSVYGSQGVLINDKHIEVIVRQMFTHAVVDTPGDTMLLPGDIVNMCKIEEENKQVQKEGGEKAEYTPALLGISKASKLSISWLDAASFEQTSAVLMENSIAGSVDGLVGLKENVIIGRRIPVRRSQQQNSK